MQLAFKDTWDGTTEERVQYFENYEDFPENIKSYFHNIEESILIFDTTNNIYHCPNCLEVLDKTGYCSYCSKKYILLNPENKTVKKVEFMEECECFSIYYFVLDRQGKNVVLYVYEEEIGYDNPLTNHAFKTKETIFHIYKIEENKITDGKTKETFFYQSFEELLKKEFFDTTDWDIYDKFFSNSKRNMHFLYLENLEELQHNKMYKYSGLWNCKEYLEKENFSIATLTYYPIYCKQFEYLVKMGLYALACDCAYAIKKKNNFKETFGVEKKYYPFMKEINITYRLLNALKLYPTTNIEILDFISDYEWLVEELSPHLKFDKILPYLEEQGLTKDNFYEYCDYIRCLKKMQLNLKDNCILFPKNFMQEHDKVSTEVIIIEDPEINKKIKGFASILSLNQYEDENFVIYPVDSIESMMEESRKQANCLRTYSSSVSNNECQIYLMREKKNLEKSFVTIEVRNAKIVQARAKYNKEVSDEVKAVLKKWENRLIPIFNREE